MLRLLKIFLWAGCVLAAIPTVRAFSPGGPIGNGGDSYQVPQIGYGIGGDILAPKNLGEEYRWNMPVLYYSFNQSFLDYFGSNAVAEVDKAFAILNDTFTNNPNGIAIGLDGYSPELTEFPTSSKQVNYTAQALQLLDLKSWTLSLMVEHLGLADPERFVWTLHDRLGPSCPGAMTYLVVKRNFDPVTFEPSSYVNQTLYSYTILEFCTGTPTAFTSPFPVDPLAESFTSVADFSANLGEFYTGLTRDDVGGFRYLLRTNNVNVEAPGPGVTLFTFVTNTIPSLTTLDLTTFLNLLPNTDPNTLLALYPNLQITSVTTNYFITNSPTTFLFITNYTWLPAGFGTVIVQANQVSQIVGTNYSYTFGNVITNHFFTNWPTIYSVSNLTVAPNSPANDPILTFSKVSKTTVLGPGGDFYILPPNVIGYILGNQIITNKGSTNVLGQIISITSQKVQFANTTFFFTNYTYVNVKVIQLVPLVSTNSTDLYQGIGKMSFVRRDYDSLFGSFQSVTNSYTLNSITGSTLHSHPVQRVVNSPDITFSAADLGTTPGDNILGTGSASRTVMNFEQHVLPQLAGPGNIRPSVDFTFDKIGPAFINFFPFLDEVGQIKLFLWGSFDGSTNAPIVYPNSTSIQNVENQILMQVTTASLPDGTNGVVYAGSGVQLQGTGGSPPYTWDIVGNALPQGLVLSSGGVISGTPATGVLVTTPFDFTVRMTDVGARSVQRDLSITIHP